MNLFAVGKIVSGFGLKGFVKVQPSTQSPGRLKELREVFLGRSADDAIAYVVEDVILNNRGVFVKFLTVNDRTSSELLRGNFLFVDSHNVASPEAGSHFVHDVLGCTVTATDGRVLGVVEDIWKLPAQDVWVVRNGGKEHLIPAVGEFIQEVDTKNRRVVVRLIEGLIED
jgi:16S rRNA processing protein RimM